MALRKLILDHCISYLLANKAPKTITTSSDEEPRHFGFWVYLKEGDEIYVIRERKARIQYQCTKFNPTEIEKDKTYSKQPTSTDLFSTQALSVNLFYNGYELNCITPLKACLLGKSRLYKLFKFYSSYRWKLSLKRHRKALSHYKDRIKLLEAMISIYEDEKDNLSVVVDDAIEINALAVKLTNSNDVNASYLSREQIEPTLRSLESDGLIEIKDNRRIKLLPKAWSELSKYIIEERRHMDSQNALRWQRILMFFLVLGSLTTALLTFIRTDVQTNLKALFSGGLW